LKDFYANVDDPAMQMVLTFLPGLAARLPAAPTLLDFGAGPTIHVAVCFRERVQKIYLADYLPQNRRELQRWREGKSSFDWTKTLKMIATREGLDWCRLREMEPATREKIDGIFYCNCLDDNETLRTSDEHPRVFDKLVTIFTLEYCCNTQEYAEAIRRVVRMVRPGGFLIMCGILEETWCSFGGRKFSCLFITREFMLQCLTDAGLLVDVEDREKTILYEINGMFMIAARKRGDE